MIRCVSSVFTLNLTSYSYNMNWKTLHLYLYTFCRYFMATIIISYAAAKLMETQFTSQPSVFDKPLSALSGFELTWYYFGYSKWYGNAIAVAQLISALLLFFRKTTRIGVILFLTFIVNILLMDFAFDIQGAKGMATLLTLMAVFVLLSDFKAFYAFFIDTPPLFTDADRPNWINKIRKIKFIYIPLAAIGIVTLLAVLKNKYLAKDELYGAWEHSVTKERLYFEAAQHFQSKLPCSVKNGTDGSYRVSADSLLFYLPKENESFHKDSLIYYSGKYSIKGKELKIIHHNKEEIFKRIR